MNYTARFYTPKYFSQEILIFVEGFSEPAVSEMMFRALFEYLQRRTTLQKNELMEIIENLPKKKKSIAISTYDMIVNEGIVKGRKEGMEKGMKEGLTLGQKQKALEVAATLIKMSELSDSQIAMAVGLPIEDVLKLRNKGEKLRRL